MLFKEGYKKFWSQGIKREVPLLQSKKFMSNVQQIKSAVYKGFVNHQLYAKNGNQLF